MASRGSIERLSVFDKLAYLFCFFRLPGLSLLSSDDEPEFEVVYGSWAFSRGRRIDATTL
jgi:hypothetical protein